LAAWQLLNDIDLQDLTPKYCYEAPYCYSVLHTPSSPSFSSIVHNCLFLIPNCAQSCSPLSTLLIIMSRSAILPLTRSPWPCLLRPPNPAPTARFLSFRFASTNPSRHSSSSAFSYRIAASYSSKEHPLNPFRNLYIHGISPPIVKAAPEISSKKNKPGRLRSGHDAFFASDVADTGTVAFGVVDGVGGWTDSGIDPADFSHALCEHMGSVAVTYPTRIEDAAMALRPGKLLDLGYNRVLRDKDVLAGSSTACVATASREGILEVAK
jgi:hypothetical protein